jgi:RNA polymerase sigma-70 factor (ECF subfamily)
MNKPTYTDKELLELIAQDNKDAFEVLFNQYYSLLARSLIRFSPDAEQIKDWIQEIFVTLWEKRCTLHHADIQNLQAYILITARNHVLQELRKKKQVKLSFQEDYRGLEVADNNLEEKISHAELFEAYSVAVANLPARTRDAFYLNREKGMTYSKVAEKMGVSVKTVEAQISRALITLHRELISFFSQA